MVLYKCLNCAVDKTIHTGHTASTDCNTKYKIILLVMLFITSWYKLPGINLYVSATAQLLKF